MMNVISDNNSNSFLQHQPVNRLHTRRRSSTFSAIGDHDSSCDIAKSISNSTEGTANERNCNYSHSHGHSYSYGSGNIIQEKTTTKTASQQNENGTKNFKDIVANFWMAPVNHNGSSSTSSGTRNGAATATATATAASSPLKKNQNSYNVLRRRSSSDFFGMFHPIEFNSSAASRKNQYPPNGSANATMNLRVDPSGPERTSSMGPLDIRGIDKQLFKLTSALNDKNSRSLNTGIDTDTDTDTDTNTNSSSNSSIKNAVTGLLTPNPVASAMVSPRRSSSSSSRSSRVYSDTTSSACSIINSATAIINSNYPSYSSSQVNGNHDATKENGSELILPGPYDVVCGRNSGAYNYIGNRRFRVTIEMNLQRYIDSPTREDKTNVIKSIVWMLRNDVGARFLKKETFKTGKHNKQQSIGKNKATPRFTVMNDKQAREKVGHALRDLVISARKEHQAKDCKYQQQRNESW